MRLKNKAVLIGIIYFIATFFLMFLSVKILVDRPMELINYLTYTIFALILSAIAVGFTYLRAGIGFIIYTLFYIFGFTYMIYTFKVVQGGWEDIIGLLSLFMMLGIGIIAGLVSEFVAYLINRKKNITYDK